MWTHGSDGLIGVLAPCDDGHPALGRGMVGAGGGAGFPAELQALTCEALGLATAQFRACVRPRPGEALRILTALNG